MIGKACRATFVGDADAFLIAFDERADHDSPNFEWFRTRYSRLVYVDRIAVSSTCRGRGLASALYRDLFEASARSGQKLVACEVNFEPPNPESDAFHLALGFDELGRARLPSGKTVRYLVRSLP